MEDKQILALYQKRDESAIDATQKKYGKYLTKIAYNILLDQEDTDESVNDTYLATWNTIPPQKPQVFSAYLSKLVRRISIDRLRKNTALKRGSGRYEISLDELQECVGEGDVVSSLEMKELGAVIGRYLQTLPDECRHVFLGRYYYMDSVREIAGYCGITEAKVKILLYRTRQGLKVYLEKEGYPV